MALVATAPLALTTYLLPSPFLRGVTVVGGAVAVIGLLALLVVQATGTATLSRGATAEQITVSELRPLIAQGWQLVNHVSLKQWDIDHVLVGPAGVIAVETKWSSHPWKLDPPSRQVIDSVRQVTDNAADLRRWLGVERVWSAVFVWAPAIDDTPRPDRSVGIQGTQVVTGRAAARHWRGALHHAEATLSTTQVDEIWKKIDTHLRSRDQYDATYAPAPATLTRAYWTVLAAVVAMFISALTSLEALTLTDSWLVWGVVTVVLVVAGATHLTHIPRAVRFGWLAGLLPVLAAAGITWVR